MADALDTPGNWSVGIDDDVPDMVALKFAEVDESGVFGYQMYLPPDVAIQYANGIITQAEWLLRNSGD